MRRPWIFPVDLTYDSLNRLALDDVQVFAIHPNWHQRRREAKVLGPNQPVFADDHCPIERAVQLSGVAWPIVPEQGVRRGIPERGRALPVH
jgi:hypothetical protein